MYKKILEITDNFLNTITMYRLVLYTLIVYIVVAVFLSSVGFLNFNPFALLFSTLFLVGICWATNKIFSSVFRAPANVESVYITALILVLIVSPASSFSAYVFLFFVGVLSMASKYILAIDNKHVFNPAAIAVVVTALFANQSASWWVGTLPMLPVVLIGGLLIVRKTQREDMVNYFLIASLLGVFISSLVKGSSPWPVLSDMILHTAFFYFAFIMLTEPLTSPHTKSLQNVFALLVGILYVPDLHFGSLYSTPELALVLGNVFSYLVSPSEKLVLYLKEKLLIAPDTWDFVFPLQKKLSYLPGQYMEWTLPHPKSDDRGNRRYFTLASSPTENNLRLGVKFNNPGSTFKTKMLGLTGHDPIVAAQRAGSFTLPKNKQEKLVFIAGGIGITPFRSMVKYLTDTHDMRDVTLIYSVKNSTDIAYREVFDTAVRLIGIKVFYVTTETMGRLNNDMLLKFVPDYSKRLYYLSGPHALVEGFKATLKSMGIAGNRIKSDFFPGFA